jgi:S-adenosylmethionine:tRNA ribosyltransferase-isomerase
MSADDSLFSYDYTLPAELIAQAPMRERDASRLMVLRRATQTIEHRTFRELPELLKPNDLLVVNETRVIPARLQGVRLQTGGRWEGLYLGSTPEGRWQLIGQTRGKLLPGEQIALRPAHPSPIVGATQYLEYRLTLEERGEGGVWRARPQSDEDPLRVLERFGTVPLPPYIGRDVGLPVDFERYQTTFAKSPGAVAAPTAGLHFTPELFDRCRERGIRTASVTLHVGVGTFRPISVDKLSDHQMHSEWCEVPAETATAVEQTRARMGRVVAIGTTTVRTLESVATRNDGRLVDWRGETNLFIRPPYRFQQVDALVTNFHLPRSSLLVLVSALAGREFILRAYREAVEKRYRFFSYGDAMLID